MYQALEVIQEDSDIIVCRKPAGIPVQTQNLTQQDMVSLLKNHRAGKGEQPEIYVVHRLDQPVEGLMVFAKNQKAAAALNRQIQQRSIDKYYYAAVEGVPDPSQGRLEDYLLRDGRTNTSRVVSADTKGAKKAVLAYRLLETVVWPHKGEKMSGTDKADRESDQESSKGLAAAEEEISLLEIQLETGRHHQIRVQLFHGGHPLVGDKKYNPRCQSGYFPIGLCSVRLSFAHPVSGKRMEYSIQPVGAAFEKFRIGKAE